MKSWLEEAREVAGMSPEDCASSIQCSRNTYLSREKSPATLSIREFFALYRVVNEEAKKIMWKALEGLRP